MKFAISFFFIILISVTSCAQRWQDLAQNYSNKIKFSFAKDMKNEKNLALAGFGGSIRDNIRLICLDFDAIDELSLEESRALIIDCVRELLRRVNADERIRPYLCQYPFDENNIDITILFFAPDGRYCVAEGKIDAVSLYNGNLVYLKYNPYTRKNTLILKETYKEGLRLVEEKEKMQAANL